MLWCIIIGIQQSEDKNKNTHMLVILIEESILLNLIC